MHTASSARKGVATWGLVAVALGLIAVATLVPTPHSAGGDATPFWCLGCGDYALADALVNVALFVPLGWAIARTQIRVVASLAVVLGTTVGIEWLQHGFIPGRVASVSDILTNTVGGAAGMAVPSLRRWIAESGGRAGGASVLYGVLLVAGLGVGAATQAVPQAGMLQWTEGSADTSRYVPFTGSLRTVRVEGAPVTLHQWRGVPTREVVEVAVDLLSGRPDTGLAHVLIAWMPSGKGWMWLEQRDRDLHVHLASASDGTRLRGHSEWLKRIFPAMPGMPVTIRLVVRPFSYRIVVVTNAGDVVRETSTSPGDGWRLLVPFERNGQPGASLLTGSWMAVLLAPLGYLASLRSRGTVVAAAAGAGACLLWLPMVSGCAWLSLPGWCGAACGLLVGCAKSAGRSNAWGRE
ncbi:MAG: hypothetical protein AUI15_22280 [Actinobacteria bacterium 13_2_20CM_2_66_6]|nr:MAG: hypothetical protein AUI15_22280 [Actinobacteria bacterium 13_2_20CM_2_66_6]